MRIHPFPAAAAALAFALTTGPADAAPYTTTVIGDPGAFIGCLSQNEADGVGFLAVGATVALFANTTKFSFPKGAAIAGTWSVDGEAPASYASKADSANTVTIDVPNTAEAVTALTTGKTLTVVANKTTATFSLDGAGAAFGDLAECMQKNQK